LHNIYRGGVNYRFGGNNTKEVPVANWGGFYIGGNGGYLTARNPSTYEIGPGGAVPPNLQTFTLAPAGYLFGAQAGYNWQAGAWVLGVEADIQGTTAREHDTCIVACSDAAGTTAYDQKLSYFGTVRGRVGYSIGATLFYATAGYAYGETKTTLAAAVNSPLVQFPFNHSKGGYAVGGGIESPLQIFGLFGPNWTTKTEYLYVDLGGSTDTLAPFVPNPTVDTFTTKTQAHIFRGGINYHFNAPVVASY
jgi:outer membrane immunogenic protein